MNLLLVNPVHPSTPHVSATRAWRFAQALSAMGHRVVLLTATLADSTGDPSSDAPGQTPSHDWRDPLVLAPAGFDRHSPATNRSALIRRFQTAWRLLRTGGNGSPWADAAVASVERLGDEFRPDTIWATYGKMEAVFVARRVSKSIGVPWVLDLKDDWELFVPRFIQNAMARRIRGWRAITANAEFTARQARKWHGATARIVYSGVDDAFLRSQSESHATPANAGQFAINLIGSLYRPDRLQVLLSGLADWLRTLPASDRQHVELRYLGGDVDMFRQSVVASELDLHTRADGFLPVEQMALDCRDASVNMYVTLDGRFHHKLLELLACERPVLVYPPESAESHALVAQVGGELIEPSDRAGVARALDALHRQWREGSGRGAAAREPTAPPNPCERYSWYSQARLLEEVLAHAARP